MFLTILVFCCVGFARASILHEAIRSQNWDLVKKLVNETNVNELDPDDPFPESPLVMAIRWNKPDAAECLLKLGADVHYEGERPLFYAIWGGKVKLVELLLDWGAVADYVNPVDHGKTPLFYAYGDSTGEVAELLMKRGARPDAQDTNGMTPMIKCAQRNKIEVIKKLVARGADIDRTYHSKSVLYWAALSNGAEILKYLGSLGAKLEVADEEGRTPLMVTASFYMLKSTKVLLECGANMHARDIHGCTALFNAVATPLVDAVDSPSLAPYETVRSLIRNHYSARQASGTDQRLEVIRLLIDEGSDVDTSNITGHSLLDLLLRRRKAQDEDIMAFLILAGMNVENCYLEESLEVLTVRSIRGILPGEHPNVFLNRVLNAAATNADFEALKKWHISSIIALNCERSRIAAAFIIARRYYTLETKYQFSSPYKGVIEEKICLGYSEMYADLLRITYLGSMPPDTFYDVLFYAKNDLRRRILSRALLVEIMYICGNDAVALVDYGTPLAEMQPYIKDILNDLP